MLTLALSYDTIQAICLLADQRIPAFSDQHDTHYEDVDSFDIPSSSQELLQRIQQLSQSELIELTALVWFGQSDMTFDELLAYAEHTYGSTLPYYLISKPLLAHYIKQAMMKLY